MKNPDTTALSSSSWHPDYKGTTVLDNWFLSRKLSCWLWVHVDSEMLITAKKNIDAANLGITNECES